MDSEPQIIIAHLYKRSGKEQLSKQELLVPLTLDLHWFSHTDAQQFITYATKQNLLKKKKDNTYSPTFNTKDVVIPTGFHPSKTSYTHEKKHPHQNTSKQILPTLLHLFSTHQKKSEEHIQKEINSIAEQKQITPEVAAAYYAKTHNIDLKEYYTHIQVSLIQENEQ